MMNLVKALLAGNRLALTRVLTQVENDTTEGRTALNELFQNTGKAHLVGITGAPGVGKSSLVNQLALHYRTQSQSTIAIIAVDPTSPFTGGAVLGDRVRMRNLAGDAGVFIRSMASRGNLGGLAHATSAMVQIFDAAGFDIILIETVGAGQAEVDIAKLAHTTLVVDAPGMGDDIQAIKAGILEIADILVINKADRPGLENTERALRGMLEMAHPIQRTFQHHGKIEKIELAQNNTSQLWVPPIQKTIANDGTGIPELAESIERHFTYLVESGDLQRREHSRLETELEALIQDTLTNQFRSRLPEDTYERVLAQILERQISPWEAVGLLLNGNNS